MKGFPQVVGSLRRSTPERIAEKAIGLATEYTVSRTRMFLLSVDPDGRVWMDLSEAEVSPEEWVITFGIKTDPWLIACELADQ